MPARQATTLPLPLPHPTPPHSPAGCPARGREGGIRHILHHELFTHLECTYTYSAGPRPWEGGGGGRGNWCWHFSLLKLAEYFAVVSLSSLFLKEFSGVRYQLRSISCSLYPRRNFAARIVPPLPSIIPLAFPLPPFLVSVNSSPLARGRVGKFNLIPFLGVCGTRSKKKKKKEGWTDKDILFLPLSKSCKESSSSTPAIN